MNEEFRISSRRRVKDTKAEERRHKMKAKVDFVKVMVAVLVVAIMWALAPRTSRAHCDTLDGPVVTTAKADESVEVGREYVKAYVEFVHYVEGLHLAAVGPASYTEGGQPQPAVQHEH
jgi:hypothetical protein